MKESGYDKLWGWFSLSYACWLTMPRVLMHGMPDKWQGQMAKLLEEFNEEFPDWCHDQQLFVTAKRYGKFVPLPEWCSRENYRHHVKEVCDSMRRQP